MKAKSEREVAQSCPTLSDPMDCSLTGSSVHGEESSNESVAKIEALPSNFMELSSFYRNKIDNK